MKLILAVIRPSSLGTVRSALLALGIGGLTVVNAAACGTSCGTSLPAYGGCFRQDAQRMQLEIAVVDEQLDQVVTALMQSTAADSDDDGKIFVMSLTRALRARTGEANNQAIRSK